MLGISNSVDGSPWQAAFVPQHRCEAQQHTGARAAEQRAAASLIGGHKRSNRVFYLSTEHVWLVAGHRMQLKRCRKITLAICCACHWNYSARKSTSLSHIRLHQYMSGRKAHAQLSAADASTACGNKPLAHCRGFFTR